MSDTTTIPPALTPHEWKEGKITHPKIYAYECSLIDPRFYGVMITDEQTSPLESVALADQSDRHAIAALCLYDQPFGFTREDVAELENAADHHDWVDAVEANRIRSIAARIAALLPPAP